MTRKIITFHSPHIGGFDLCSYSYTFTVTSVALDGSMESDGVNQAPLDLEGEYHNILLFTLGLFSSFIRSWE